MFCRSGTRRQVIIGRLTSPELLTEAGPIFGGSKAADQPCRLARQTEIDVGGMHDTKAFTLTQAQKLERVQHRRECSSILKSPETLNYYGV